MTTTNQAFIRIYRQDPAELGPSGPIIAHSGRHSLAALRASVEIVAATGSTGRTAGEAGSNPAFVATSIDILPPKAELPAAIGLSSRARQRESTLARQRTAPSSQRFGPSNTPKRPLSSFINRQRAADPPVAQDHPHNLRAGTTVASFRWPPVCRALLQQSAAELDELADRIQPQPHTASGAVVVGVLGLFRGNGCTTMSLCLAARIAGRGRRVILVDGNFASPRMAQLLDAVPTLGWQESLASGAPIADAIVHAMDDRLDLLALGLERTRDPLELLGRPQTANAAAQLRAGYEIVLVDLGAFFDPRSQPVALELISRLKIETVLAITGAEVADPRDLATLADRLEQRGCTLAGVAENRIAN